MCLNCAGELVSWFSMYGIYQNTFQDIITSHIQSVYPEKQCIVLYELMDQNLFKRFGYRMQRISTIFGQCQLLHESRAGMV